MKRFAVLSLAALIALGSAATAVEAQPYNRGRSPQDQAREDVREGRRVPLQQVIADIARRTPGEYVSARETGNGYIVRWKLPDGRIIDIPVSAER